MLKIENVTVKYGARAVLQEVSLLLEPGQILALIGPNGAGKSTLIRTLSGAVPLVHGRIAVNDLNLTHMQPQERARLLAFVPQAINLPPAFSAWETVLLGRTPHLNWLGQTSPKDEELVRQAMVRTQTLELAARPVGELSGGEQQRLLLARALAQNTPILVMDEPTAHLDLHYQLTLLNQVQSLAKEEGLAVLVALHDLNLAVRYADLAALLVEGRLEAYGDPTHVLTPATLSRAYQVPLMVAPLVPGGKPVIMPTIQ